MGSLPAQEMSDLLPMDQAVEWHLTGNHFPPISTAMVQPAIEAIDACNEEDYERLIITPFDHVTYGTQVPAHVIVEALHLEFWIEEAE